MKMRLIIYAAVSVLAALSYLATSQILVRALLANTAAAFFLVCLAHALNNPKFFGKTANGKFFLPFQIVLWPFLAFNGARIVLLRLFYRESLMHEIDQYVWVGSKPWPFDRSRLKKAGIRSVLDLMPEANTTEFVLRELNFQSTPVLDLQGAPPDVIDEAIAWINRQKQYGNVLIHCDLGHGRSGLIAAAYLWSENPELGEFEVLEKVHSVRPRIHLNAAQREALLRWKKKQPL